jgi:3-dehydroquinate dehydratase-2
LRDCREIRLELPPSSGNWSKSAENVQAFAPQWSEPEPAGLTRARGLAEELGHTLDCYQSNAEHELVERVQKAAKNEVEFILLNPGAFTHTSVALRDALLAVDIPFIEIHLSNTFAREEFRHNSYFSDVAEGCVIGLGAMGYELALHAAAQIIADAEED